MISVDAEDIEDGHAAKKRRMDDHVVSDSPTASQSKKLKIKSSSSHSTLSSSSATGNMNSSIYSQSRQTSERRVGTGMNPRRILTGIRGSRNEVIRRTVYDGALRVENEPYKIIKEAMADFLLGSEGRIVINGPTPSPPILSARPEWRKLLPLTGFIRPSVHTSVEYMTVTELTLVEESPSEELDTDSSAVGPTIAKILTVPILISPEMEGAGIEHNGVEGEGPMTIRGGGGLEEETFSTRQHNAISGDTMDVSAIDELESKPATTTNLREDMQLEFTEVALEETAPDECIQEISDALQGDESLTETHPETSYQVFDKTTSADVGTALSSSEVDVSNTTPSSDLTSTAVDFPAASDEANLIAGDKERVPEITSAEDNTPPVGQDKAAHEVPPNVMPVMDTQPSASSATVEANTVPPTIVSDVLSSNSEATPTTIASSITLPSVCQVVSLPPNTQLSTSLYRPTSAPNEEDSNRTLVRPPWYQSTKASEFEKRTLPEWFNFTAPHRTETTYIATRESMLKLSKCNAQQYITTTAIRRSVAGDAGSLLRLHKFLMDWGLLNGGQIGETAPSDAVLRGVHTEEGSLARSKRKKSQMQQSSVSWSVDRMHVLEVSVVKHTSKNSDEGNNGVKISVDWDAIASDMGDGVTASDCQIAFINPPTEEDMLGVSALASSNNWSFSKFLAGVRPEVLKAAVEASLQFTNEITEVRKASIVAALASTAAQEGARIESEIETTLMDIVDQRLQRLENRVAIVDDVEALLEAERVSLELERRDMYTTRCRHWFGNGSS